LAKWQARCKAVAEYQLVYVMKFNIVASVMLVFMFAANIYIYQQNKDLLKKIEYADGACMRKVVAAEQRYKKQINELSEQLENQPDMVVLKEVGVQSNLDDMASYGHLFRAVSNKYEFLLQTVKLSTKNKKELMNHLIDREKLSGVTFRSLVEIDDEERVNFVTRLASAEDSIKEILRDPVDYERYEYLKDRTL
jgi:CRISPR/Cas system CSM-associated protein Csm4 (group 5 of RAMP superfamily)